MNSDPSLQGGWTEAYQREVAMVIGAEGEWMDDQVMFRVFSQEARIKIEMTSESNVSLLYVCVLPLKQLKMVGDKSMTEHLEQLKFLFSGELKYKLTLTSSEEAELVVEEVDKYKTYKMAEFSFKLAEQQAVRQSLMFRFQRMKEREAMLDRHWDHMVGVVRLKNPSLLLMMSNRSRKNAFK